MYGPRYNVRKPAVFGIALCLGIAATGTTQAGLLAGVTNTVTDTTETLTGSLTGDTSTALITDRAYQLRSTMATLPSLVEQAKASPAAVYQLYHASLYSPFAFLPQYAGLLDNNGPQRFLDRFPRPQRFVTWLETLQTDPAQAISAFQNKPQYAAELLEDLDNVTRMLAERLPAGMAGNLPVAGQLMADCWAAAVTALDR